MVFNKLVGNNDQEPESNEFDYDQLDARSRLDAAREMGVSETASKNHASLAGMVDPKMLIAHPWPDKSELQKQYEDAQKELQQKADEENEWKEDINETPGKSVESDLGVDYSSELFSMDFDALDQYQLDAEGLAKLKEDNPERYLTMVGSMKEYIETFNKMLEKAGRSESEHRIAELVGEGGDLKNVSPEDLAKAFAEMREHTLITQFGEVMFVIPSGKDEPEQERFIPLAVLSSESGDWDGDGRKPEYLDRWKSMGPINDPLRGIDPFSGKTKAFRPLDESSGNSLILATLSGVLGVSRDHASGFRAHLLEQVSGGGLLTGALKMEGAEYEWTFNEGDLKNEPITFPRVNIEKSPEGEYADPENPEVSQEVKYGSYNDVEWYRDEYIGNRSIRSRLENQLKKGGFSGLSEESFDQYGESPDTAELDFAAVMLNEIVGVMKEFEKDSSIDGDYSDIEFLSPDSTPEEVAELANKLRDHILISNKGEIGFTDDSGKIVAVLDKPFLGRFQSARFESEGSSVDSRDFHKIEESSAGDNMLRLVGEAVFDLGRESGVGNPLNALTWKARLEDGAQGKVKGISDADLDPEVRETLLDPSDGRDGRFPLGRVFSPQSRAVDRDKWTDPDELKPKAEEVEASEENKGNQEVQEDNPEAQEETPEEKEE